MKKIKVIGIAAAALLAVSPLLASNTAHAASINYNGTSYNDNATVDEVGWVLSAAFFHRLRIEHSKKRTKKAEHVCARLECRLDG